MDMRMGLPNKKRELSSLFILPSVAIAATVSISLLFSCFSAIRASLGFIFKAFFLVESLFPFGKNKFCVAILANQCFVRHIKIPPLIYFG